MKKIDVVTRFWSRVNKTNNCWEWMCSGKYKRYGDITLYKNGKTIHKLAHRFSWELHHGAIPNGLFVCHSCDNKLCVNPNHLFLGTAKDNAIDCVKKGRSNIGVKHGRAKLTEQKVIQILHLIAQGYSQSGVARMFGVSKRLVGKITSGEL